MRDTLRHPDERSLAHLLDSSGPEVSRMASDETMAEAKNFSGGLDADFSDGGRVPDDHLPPNPSHPPPPTPPLGTPHQLLYEPMPSLNEAASVGEHPPPKCVCV